MNEADPTEEEVARRYLASTDAPHVTINPANLQTPSEFSEYIRQQILDAYGFDDWTPEERAVFDAWGRVDDALKAEREAFAASIPARANAIAPQLPDLIAAAFPELADDVATLVAAGARFEWRADG